MGLRIGTNTQSLAAQRSLGINSAAQKSSLEKLASGSRIVRAGDDAAGLAISEKIRAQTRSLRQDVRNASDGISMIQTAEGGMNEVGNILIRFRELSIQAASDTIGDTERGFIDKEVQHLKKEVERISQSTEFNGRKLLDGEGDVIEIQIGINNNPDIDRFAYDVSSVNSTLYHLDLDKISTVDKVSAQHNLAKVDDAIKEMSRSRSELGAMQNRLQSVVNNLNIYSENLSAARSRIFDVDMASETAELTKNNILTTADISLLGQANQNPTLALKLVS